MGVLPRPAVHPLPVPTPSLCVWVHVSVWACARTSPFPSPPQPPPHPTLIAAIPVAAGCHSAVTPLPIFFRGGKEGGWEGEQPPASPAPTLPLPLYQKSRRW